MATLIQISAVSAMAQCLEGYESDVIAVNSPVYASAGNNSTPFKVGTLSKNQKVCVNEDLEGNYAKIRYGNKTGYVHLQSLRSHRTEASANCTTCGSTEARRPVASTQADASEIKRVAEVSKPKSTPRIQVAAGLGEPLSYAQKLMDNNYLGLEVAVLGNWCGRAVSRILRGAGVLPGPVPRVIDPGGFAGKDAKAYLEGYGFRDDRTACNRPGVVLVYAGGGKAAVPKGAKFTSGDTWGHAEILGTDGRYHHFTNSTSRIDEIMGKARRPLIGCMVKGN